MRVLFDTNVLLDALLAREPFVEDAAPLLEAIESSQIEGFMSATTVTDVHYLVGRQTRHPETAITAVTRLLELMEICTVDRNVLEQAIAPSFQSYRLTPSSLMVLDRCFDLMLYVANDRPEQAANPYAQAVA